MQRLILTSFMLLTFVACSSDPQPPLVASNVVVNEPLPGRAMSAGYLSLTNNSDEAIRINRVSSPDFSAAELHESSIVDGVAKMRPVDALVIAPGSTVTLQQGGLHLMLMRPRSNADTVSLNFYQDTTLLLGVQTPITRRSN